MGVPVMNKPKQIMRAAAMAATASSFATIVSTSPSALPSVIRKQISALAAIRIINESRQPIRKKFFEQVGKTAFDLSRWIAG
jgi:hypothetical protein